MERFTRDKIPAGYVAIEGDEYPEIIWPLIQAIQGRIVDLPPDSKFQAEIDETIEGLKASGDLRDFAKMSDGAFSLLKEKIAKAGADAATAVNLGDPFMICPSAIRANKQRLLIDLIQREFRSPKVQH